MYLEHALKYNNLNRAIVLSNCFMNRMTIGSGYKSDVEKDVDKYCPNVFNNGIRIPEFYLNIIKSKIK